MTSERLVTPPLGACCASPEKRCAPDPAVWTHPVWQALKFSMDEPHYYSYTYAASGTDVEAQYTVGAIGDLDCDGVYSTFEMVGRIGSDGTVSSGGGMFRDNELE